MDIRICIYTNINIYNITFFLEMHCIMKCITGHIFILKIESLLLCIICINTLKKIKKYSKYDDDTEVLFKSYP